MIKKKQFYLWLSAIFVIIGCLHSTTINCLNISAIIISENLSGSFTNTLPKPDPSEDVAQLNLALKTQLTMRNYPECRIIIKKIKEIIEGTKIEERILMESNYFIGIYNLLTSNFTEALKYLSICESFKNRNNDYDEFYGKILYNLGVIYGRLGDFKKHEDYSMRSLAIEEKIFGSNSPKLFGTYGSLIIAYIELQDYERSLIYANLALSISGKNEAEINPLVLADLYNNLGVINIHLADYSKAKMYLEKSESIFEKNNHFDDENYINLMNNMAITYGALKLSDKSDEYYTKGITMAISLNSKISFNLVNSYAIILANNGNRQKGEILLNDALQRARRLYGENSQIYIEILNNYAEYLREYDIDNAKSLLNYEKCIGYLAGNNHDKLLMDAVNLGYSLSLNKAGESVKALETIQLMLFPEQAENKPVGLYDNPVKEFIKADKKHLRILKTKYKILSDILQKTHDDKVLEAAAGTAELIISTLEKIRININEEESRLLLGDRYKDSYLNAIRDFNLLYRSTGSKHYLEKAFEYSEKCKVAGLLASTRELKATQFHIPVRIAEYEKRLQRDISLYNARITEELIKSEYDTLLINNWNEKLLESTRLRDSLILVFENNYPDYYSIKYNTAVVQLKDISSVIGRNGNYINYISSDTILYIFIANRENQHLLSVPVNSSFFDNIKQFRMLMSLPLTSDNARNEYDKFMTTGFDIYNTIVAPVRKYLISDKLVVSPDNILSYIPFEALPVSKKTGDNIQYREIEYLMNDFVISYTYSATFLSESFRSSSMLNNNLIAFAPSYPVPIDIKSVLLNRQSELGILSDLPYARQEAEFVADITGGKFFTNGSASESAYKAESGKYNIIHLAMHTILNDKDPMQSTLIFSNENDTVDDSYLKTYEVYGIPLNAKMVVLSSCNTGSGLLYSGEGILSLARGFIYAGSESVVMSMWEIEDRSGTEIVKKFYKNLLKGYSKSVSLRKARISYLKNADQLRSHPYFWATLVIYGNNSPLYFSWTYLSYSLIAVSILALGLILYFKKRKYS